MKKIFLLVFLFVSSFYVFAAKVYKSSATASYYGKDFHGKKTSNGEVFNMNDLTCAHKSLPFDTILRVTNLSNGKTVKVRVNDRGPFVVGREIDLSTAAAKKLDMMSTGTAKVKIEILKMGPDTALSRQTAEKAREIMAKKEGTSKSSSSGKKKSTSTSKKKTTESQKTENEVNNGDNLKDATQNNGNNGDNPEQPVYWDVQIGAFKSKENARKRAKALSEAGFSSIVIQKTGEIYRVAIKEVKSEDVAELEGKLQEKGFSEYTIRKRNVSKKTD
jgi:rare lipoprotein A